MDSIKLILEVDKQKLPVLRGALANLLQNSICKVKFEKVDGTLREMKCTLRSDRIPVVEAKSDGVPKKERKESLEVLPVYELTDNFEKDGWRSFRLDSLIGIEVLYE